MKNLTKTSVLLCVCGIALILGCKKDEVDPVDKLMGLYQSGLIPVGYIPRHNPGFRMRLRKTENGFVHVTAFGVVYGRVPDPNPNLGIRSLVGDFEFPKCKIVFIDTTGANFRAVPFAALIDTEKNRELGQIRYWFGDPNGVKTEYYNLMVNFFVNDSARVNRFVYKWTNY
ncbi:MAG: hypothetical protein ACK4GN_09630 [Runella sp.]